MPRTTIDIDASVLRALKLRQAESGKSLGQLASELIATALEDERPEPEPLAWIARPMGARVDLEDDEALARALERE
jgi:plasmid stability protein